jgi:proteic killer suppression protein
MRVEAGRADTGEKTSTTAYAQENNLLGYIAWVMIRSFKHKGLEDFFYTGSKKGIKPEHAKRL